MILETERLILRPWQPTDSASLYEYAKNPLLGPAAGWPIHQSLENSSEIIRTILSAPEAYAITIKNDKAAIGSIGLMTGDQSNLNLNGHEAEIGYWVGVPHWGLGFATEAARELVRHAFERLGLSVIWCGYFDGNEKSKRVSEKCGFTYHHTEKDKLWPLTGEIKTQHLACLTKETWANRNGKF